MDEDDQPTLVFTGKYEEIVFLMSLLDASGIESWSDPLAGRGPGSPRLFVHRRNAAEAIAIVADFERNGTHTTS